MSYHFTNTAHQIACGTGDLVGNDHAFSVAAWIYRETSNGTDTIVCKRGGWGTSNQFDMAMGQGTTVSVTANTTARGGATVGTGAWHLIVYACDGTSTLEQVDGTQSAAAGALTSGSASTGAAIGIGRLITEAGEGTTGTYIAEVAVWNRKLSVAEMQSLYVSAGSGNAASTIPTGLVAYWPLKDNANDSVGGHNGTVTGAVLDASHPTISAGAASSIVRQMIAHHEG